MSSEAAVLDAALAALRRHQLGQGAAPLGHAVHGEAGRVTMQTVLGGRRIVDMPFGEQLPRSC